jgi:DNA-binding CsgD family transcriptional regulator
MSDVRVDAEWAALTDKGLAENPEDIPPPPWQMREMKFIMVGVSFDRSAVRRMLPPRFEPTPQSSGGFYLYDAPTGWGVPPYSAAVGWIDIEGYDCPHGAKARHIFLAWYSDRGYRGFSRYGGSVYQEGHARHTVTDGIAEGFGGPIGHDWLRLAIRIKPSDPPTTSGVQHYVSEHGGSVFIGPAAFSMHLFEAEPLAVELTVPADHPFADLAPTSLLWAGYTSDAAVTISGARAVLNAEDLQRPTRDMAYLHLFDTVGRGAILVGPTARVIFMNPMAQALLGDGLGMTGGFLQVDDPVAGARLGKAIEQVLEAGGDIEPIGVPRPSGRKPLIIQVFRIEAPEPVTMANRSAMLLINDPGWIGRGDPLKVLQLLGLTPAESKIAALVGSGLSPREAAGLAGNTESTVRDTLKQVYEKLDIGRQSELAKLVARVGA